MTTVYEKDYDYEAKSGQYRLIVADECPFAHRTAIALHLLGLDDHISFGTVFPYKTEKVWEFSHYEDGLDPVLQVRYVEDLYKNTDSNYQGSYSVPILVDTQSKKVVNQESLDLVYDFATRFRDLHKKGAPDLYPENKREEIDQAIKWLTNKMMSPGFKAGFAKDQASYDENVEAYFEALEQLDSYLANHDWLVGETITIADIIAYTPLVRLDVSYATAYKLNKKRIYDFPHLWPYMHKLYSIPAFKETTNFENIKKGSNLGKNGRLIYVNEINPIGPDQSPWDEAL